MTVGEREAPSILKLLGVAAVGLLAVTYLTVAFSTEDALWFWPGFHARPASLFVHCDGRTLEVTSGSIAFEELVKRLDQGLWGWKRWTPLSMSDSTWMEYREGVGSQVLEFRYDRPVDIHSHFRFFKDVDTLVVPLRGRHAEACPVFGLRNGRPVAGALHLDDTATLLEVIRSESLCP